MNYNDLIRALHDGPLKGKIYLVGERWLFNVPELTAVEVTLEGPKAYLLVGVIFDTVKGWQKEQQYKFSRTLHNKIYKDYESRDDTWASCLAPIHELAPRMVAETLREVSPCR